MLPATARDIPTSTATGHGGDGPMAPARGTIVPTDADVEQLAGYAAILAAIAGVGYAVAFVVVKSDLFSAVFLLVGSALSLVPLVTVYGRFRNAQPTLARW